ncbi:glycosylphosphatidylinositol-alpha 1,4 mannosyltransferase I [Aspergillus clavatus NRRL 1]|uniref:GPI mannosyltransferase 1 n=1 Tax=Aspergillus clavatus (strain ATCC 1007 / CBS 513.65 / DSM 816 / NCTC 3887 / NRRL 1 / QM 1276 / 107) TaxID=344612 RepID=A1CGB0_ASPCL|nr:mannosyltransferase (PIG-M), putative [Aspergillus clavatus NRRL 1]EAW10990.1 mannosyltransferase (PIG-M), putative [Aspergillus clavatus NRRL 1]
MAKTSFFDSPAKVYGASIALRAVLLVYGAWQDAHSAVKYTDIDYLVFTDAARFVARGASPYARDTYRYTPLLAWLLLPTTWSISGLFSFGKALFALADVLAGWLIAQSLVAAYGLPPARARKYAAVWLLNPMVANISTRGSSEGLLGVLVVALLWASLSKRVTLAGVLLGLAVHFKIYPFIYGASIVWWMDWDSESTSSSSSRPKQPTLTPGALVAHARAFLTPARLHLTLVALATFSALNTSMYILYGPAFAHHTYLHHLTRIDHRHNFSPYSTLLYLSAAGAAPARFETLAFLPQLLLSVVLIPIALAKKSLPGAMLAQTFAFVTFNKVCTSQYFLWYLVFLPFYLPKSSVRGWKGVVAGLAWVGGQALWLQQGYGLEFLGESTFVPGLFLASLGFFVVNVWILGIIVTDVGKL